MRTHGASGRRPAAVQRGILGRAVAMSVIALVSLFLMIGAQPRTALAHNSLEQSDPAAGQTLAVAPVAWTLTFTKDVPLDSASGEIIAADGSRTRLAPPVHGASTKQIIFALPAGLSGSVTARWRLVGTDGHVLTARVAFTVTGGSAASTTAPVAAGTPSLSTVAPSASSPAVAGSESAIADDPVTSEPVRLLLRLLSYAGILAVGGLLFVETALARGVLSVPRAGMTLAAGAAALTVVPLLQVLVFLDDSRGHGIIGSVPRILESFSTTAGSMLIIRSVTGAVMLSAALAVIRGAGAPAHPARFAAPAVTAAAAMHLVALAYVGHSRSMAWPLLGIPADIVHTAAAAVWFGGLVMLVVFVLPAVDPGLQFDAFRRFGRFAGHAVTAIVVTGVIQTLRLHGTILTLFTQTHGRWLLLKLVFVAVMLKIGDINRRRLLRRMPHGDAAIDARVGMLRRASITELASGAAVMTITSLLVTSSFD